MGRDLEQAIALLENLNEDQQFWHALSAVGETYEQQGKTEKALELYQQAEKLGRADWQQLQSLIAQTRCQLRLDNDTTRCRTADTHHPKRLGC